MNYDEFDIRTSMAWHSMAWNFMDGWMDAGREQRPTRSVITFCVFLFSFPPRSLPHSLSLFTLSLSICPGGGKASRFNPPLYWFSEDGYGQAEPCYELF
jgi:hypothetical protein